MRRRKVEREADAELQFSEWRGLIIHCMIILEWTTDEIIIRHFCKNSKIGSEFLHVVLSREQFNLRFKLDVLNFILINHHPDFLNKNKKFFKDYESMIRLRNNIAHKKFLAKNPINNPKEMKLHLQAYSTERSKMKLKTIPLSDEFVRNNAILILDLNGYLSRHFRLPGWKKKPPSI